MWYYHWQQNATQVNEMAEAHKFQSGDVESYEWRSLEVLTPHRFVRDRSQHPCISETDGLHQPISVMRSWRANVDGIVIVTGKAARTGQCGDGTGCLYLPQAVE